MAFDDEPLARQLLDRRALLRGALAAGVSFGLGLGLTTEAEADENDPFPLPPFDYKKLAPEFRRVEIGYTGRHRPGTIIVDTAARQLTFVMPGKRAMRYGCAVGRDGFRWAGLADVGRKVTWPRWTPPAEMIERSPEKAKWKNGMPGGPENPLGARALPLSERQ